jgi:hypothetical protein
LPFALALALRLRAPVGPRVRSPVVAQLDRLDVRLARALVEAPWDEQHQGDGRHQGEDEENALGGHRPWQA